VFQKARGENDRLQDGAAALVGDAEPADLAAVAQGHLVGGVDLPDLVGPPGAAGGAARSAARRGGRQAGGREPALQGALGGCLAGVLAAQEDPNQAGPPAGVLAAQPQRRLA
jgi:hypothetical protein